MPPTASLPGLPDDYESKLFHGDMVTKVGDPEYRGKVVRSWTDEDAPPDPYHPQILDKPLVRGEVIICHVTTGEYETASELDLQLFERQFMKGDLVKHTLTDIESAVVIDTKTECKLGHVISGERLPRWIPWNQLRNAVQIEAKDRVVYDEWIGTVEEVLEEGLVESRFGPCYSIAEMGGLLETGRRAAEVVPENTSVMNSLWQFPPYAHPADDRVVTVRPLIIFIVWNAINQTLPVAEHDKHPEPSRFWCGADIEKLTHFEVMKNQAPPLATTVMFRNTDDETAAGGKATAHFNNTFQLRVYRVVENRTTLRLRWQDGTETEELSVGFVPYRNVDDYESWPGEHLVWKSDTGSRPAVVQSYNPRQRIAELLLLDTKEKESVSVLELDTGGFGKVNYGVGLGQTVLFCDDNGAKIPEVPSLGQVDPPVDGREGFRQELSKIDRAQVFLPKGDSGKAQWWGEVVDQYLDGTVCVEVYSGERKVVDIKQLIVLNEAEEPFPGDEMDDGASFMSDKSWETMSEDEQPYSAWDGGENGYSVEDMEVDGDDDDAQSAADAEAVDRDTQMPEATPSPIARVRQLAPESPVAASRTTTTTTGIHASPATSPKAGPSSPRASTSTSSRPPLADSEKWARFEMLEEAPAEHYYYPEPVMPAAKAYHSRLMKEHRALASSLPDNILVRTYEDRADLMRVLIVGPEGTPYADAPFVFDVYLNPTKFPFEPPLVYFHSHTNGLGRCNPNLYEEGKVCLSILGTWAGDKSESWNPQKSSLLQVFVSISGLVLVRNPYHCEPAFAKLEGTREGRVNSRLYSEKAYVLSRSFVRTALERPPVGLEGELNYLYFERGRLALVIAHARRLIEKGEAAAKEGKDDEDEENEEMWNADAMGSLTMGAIITLKRTIAALEKILIKYSWPDAQSAAEAKRVAGIEDSSSA